MADIFISYARDDRAKIQSIVQELEEQGYAVWYDASLEAGETFSDEIMRELEDAKCVIVVWSENSARSTWAYSEADIARERNILVPVRIDDARLPPPFNAIETIDLRHWRGDPADTQWDRVLAKAHDLCRGGRMVRRARSYRKQPSSRAPVLWLFFVALIVAIALYFEPVRTALVDLVTPSPTAWAENWDRERIAIVGSSTIEPLAERVALSLGGDNPLARPRINSQGTNSGFDNFCGGLGDGKADIAMASRRQTVAEYEECVRHGVREVVELKIGYGAIVLAEDRSEEAAALNLSLRHLFLAFAERVPRGGSCTDMPRNTARSWRDVDPALPDRPIIVYGPGFGSGTRDAFTDLAMEAGARTFLCLREMEREDPRRFRRLTHAIRRDGVWIDTEENDPFTVRQVLAHNGPAIGILGYPSYFKRQDDLRSIAVDGQVPSARSKDDYRLSRWLYLYVKKPHVAQLPAIHDFVLAFTDEAAWGDQGYLVREEGLIPMTAGDRGYWRGVAERLDPYQH